MGGLGNQIFRYAAAYNLAKKTNSKLYIIVGREAAKKGIIHSQDRNPIYSYFNISEDKIIYVDQIDKFFIKQHYQIRSIGSANHPLKKLLRNRLELLT